MRREGTTEKEEAFEKIPPCCGEQTTRGKVGTPVRELCWGYVKGW